MTGHEVKLEVFEGPIDLLLHLITRQRVDIYDVSLSTITDEYLSVLSRLDGMDLEQATGFLVIAATLLELKSIRLLPARQGLDEEDQALLEERDLLLAKLVECATFREAGVDLHVALQAGSSTWPRQVALEEPYANLQPTVELRVTMAQFTRAAARVFSPAPRQLELDMAHVSPIRASVRDAIEDMVGALKRKGSLTFEELCGFGLPRIEVVVRFLGLLELFKAGAVDLSQDDRFGAIQASWTGDADTEEIMAEVEEYTGTTEVSA